MADARAPIGSITGRRRRVAVFTTGPAATDTLDADIVSVSRNLANRPLLSEDLARADADVYPEERLLFYCRECAEREFGSHP